MGLFGAYNLVRAIAVAHIFIGYILITAPQKLATQSTIVILGEALGLVRASPFSCYSPLLEAIAHRCLPTATTQGFLP